MEYGRHKINNDVELDLLIGLIVNSDFTQKIRSSFKKELLTLPYTKQISEWAIEYFDKYGKAINKDIISVFNQKKESIKDQSQIDTIDLFIQRLNDRYENSESFNIEYELDKSIKFLRTRSLDSLIDSVKIDKLSGNIEAAEAKIANFKRIEKGRTTATSVWYDIDEAVKSIRTEDDKDIIVKFHGDLGKVIRPLRSEDYIAFIAPPKRGKTFWLMEIAVQASMNKKNVLFVTLEMPARQLRTRIFQRITGMVVGHDCETEISVPYFDNNYELTKKTFFRKERRECLTARNVVRQMEAIQGLIKQDNFRIIEAPSNSMTERDLESHLDNLEHYDGFIPNMIVMDYADIMLPLKHSDHRNEINSKWEGLRRIGQERNMLIATVSHTVRATLNRDVRIDDVVEDVRKLSHLTMCIGVNQMDIDKDMGVQRLSVLIDRFADFNPRYEAVVTQCLKAGAVYLDSRTQFKGVREEV